MPSPTVARDEADRPVTRASSVAHEPSSAAPTAGGHPASSTPSMAVLRQALRGDATGPAQLHRARIHAHAAGIVWDPREDNQRMAALVQHASTAEARDLARTSTGEALPEAVRARMEQAFDHDFGHVRVHTDDHAARASELLSAHAFALGADVFFSGGAFAPGTAEGDRLLAHELTHVVQHDEGRLPRGGGVSSPSDPAEREAYANEAAICRSLATVDAAPESVEPSPAEQLQAATAPLVEAVGLGDESLSRRKLPWIRGTTEPDGETKQAVEIVLFDPKTAEGPEKALVDALTLRVPKASDSPLSLFMRPAQVVLSIEVLESGGGPRKVAVRGGVEIGAEAKFAELVNVYAVGQVSLEGSATAALTGDGLDLQSMQVVLSGAFRIGIKLKDVIDQRIDLLSGRVASLTLQDEGGEWSLSVDWGPTDVEAEVDKLLRAINKLERLIESVTELDLPDIKSAAQLEEEVEAYLADKVEEAGEIGEKRRAWRQGGYTEPNAHNLAVAELLDERGLGDGDERAKELALAIDRQTMAVKVGQEAEVKLREAGVADREIERVVNLVELRYSAPYYRKTLSEPFEVSRDDVMKEGHKTADRAVAIAIERVGLEGDQGLDEEGKDAVAEARAEWEIERGGDEEFERAAEATEVEQRERRRVERAREFAAEDQERLLAEGVPPDEAQAIADRFDEAWRTTDETVRALKLDQAEVAMTKARKKARAARRAGSDAAEEPAAAEQEAPAEEGAEAEAEEAQEAEAAEAEEQAPSEGADGSEGDVQRKASGSGGADDPARAHAAAARGTAGGGAALPYQDRIQASFGGHDLSGVSAHVGGEAAGACEELSAVAYAHGDHIAFRDTPSLHTAAHEAAHVVQQRAGVALADGVGQSGDAWERHADAVADAVVRGDDAAPLLDRVADVSGACHTAVQREEDDEEAGGSAPDGDIVIEEGRADPEDFDASLETPVRFANRDADARTVQWHRAGLPDREGLPRLEDVKLQPGATAERSFDTMGNYPFYVAGEGTTGEDVAHVHAGTDSPRITLIDAAGTPHGAEVDPQPGAAGGRVEGFCFLDTDWNKKTPDFRGELPLLAPFLGLFLEGNLQTTGAIQLLVDGVVIREDDGTSFRVTGDASFGSKSRLTIKGTLQAGASLEILSQEVAAGLGGSITATTSGLSFAEGKGADGATVDLRATRSTLFATDTWSLKAEATSDLDFSGDLWAFASTDTLFDKGYYTHDLVKDGDIGTMEGAAVPLNARGKRNELEHLNGFDMEQLIAIKDLVVTAWPFVPWP